MGICVETMLYEKKMYQTIGQLWTKIGEYLGKLFLDRYIGHCLGVRFYDKKCVGQWVSYGLKQGNPFFILNKIYSKIQWNQIWNIEIIIILFLKFIHK